MEQISKPDKINYTEGEMDNQGIVTIEPFYPGYGMTLGNSIRRVLLSSLTGYAISSVKIKGAGHEFTTLPHIKEDILEIILNLKQVCLKILGDEEVKLELDVTGKKVVTAGDIKDNGKVEIINKDLVIANITDVAGNLSMEITAKFGRGYDMVGQRQEDKKNIEIGAIEIDAIYSPVLFVGTKVESVRVGKMTDWDRLIFKITTDGTITPKDAFDQSIDILMDQFGALTSINSSLNESQNKKKKKKDKKVKKESKTKTKSKTSTKKSSKK